MRKEGKSTHCFRQLNAAPVVLVLQLCDGRFDQLAIDFGGTCQLAQRQRLGGGKQQRFDRALYISACALGCRTGHAQMRCRAK